jgi:nitrite reductase/ring-hydroxylating ferredoxin subunit
LDELLESEVADFELAETSSADRLFERRWALAVLEQVLTRLESEYRAAKNAALFGTPLDWWPNEFFSHDGQFLTCGTHGSLYDPETGKCAGGPCYGGALFPLQVQATGDRIVVSANSDE